MLHETKLAIVKDINLFTFDLNMGKTVEALTIFILLSISSVASVRGAGDSCKSISLAISPTEMVSGFETIYLEYKFSKHLSIMGGAGHIFPLVDKIIVSDKPTWAAFNGTTIRLQLKYFLKKSGRMYIGLMGTYKDLYYSWHTFNISCQRSDPDKGGISFIRSEKSSVFGTATIFGIRNQISKKIVYDFFIGIGLSNRNSNYTNHSINSIYSYCNSFPILGHFTESTTAFSVPVGFKIGYIFHQKKDRKT